MLSRVQLFAIPRTVTHQAPLYMEILQARILEWVAMPSSRDLPNPGTEPRSPTLQAVSLLTEPPGKPSECKDFIANLGSGLMKDKAPQPSSVRDKVTPEQCGHLPSSSLRSGD